MIISSDKASFSLTTGKFVAEASTLGMPVGSFPEVIRYGAYGAFRMPKKNINNEGELESIEYKNASGEILLILND
jgi:hypothetical protein